MVIRTVEERPPSEKRFRPPLVSVVLPCLNEEEAVGPSVRKAIQVLEQAGLPAEILVVDNGSEDSSATRAAEAGAKIVREPVRGYGMALRAGFASAKGEVIVMADADGSYDFTKLPDLVSAVLSGEGDMVIGSRFGEGHQAGSMPFLHKRVGTPVLSWITRRITGIKVIDSQSGFRAFSREAFDRLNLQSSGMELASEMILKASAEGLRLIEIPTGYRPRQGDSKLSPMEDAWRHLRLLALWGPHIFFVIPGLASMILGAMLMLMILVQGGRVAIGPFVWRPIFFDTILLAVGLQAALFGTMLLSFSSYAPPRWQVRAVRLLDPARLLAKAFWATGLVVLGILFEICILIASVAHLNLGVYRLSFSSLAQDCLILGGTLGLFVGAVAALASHEPSSFISAAIFTSDRSKESG